MRRGYWALARPPTGTDSSIRALWWAPTALAESSSALGAARPPGSGSAWPDHSDSFCRGGRHRPSPALLKRSTSKNFCTFPVGVRGKGSV